MPQFLSRTPLLAALLVAAATSAQADTLNFSGLPFNNANPLVLSNATITNLTGTTIYVGAAAAGEVDGFCFQGSGCEADGEITFGGVVSSLSFDVDGWQQGDFVAITAFNGLTSLGSLNATGNGNLNFSAFGDITRLVFDDSSTAAGVGYSTFSFNAQGNAVPVPGTLALAGLALAGLATLRRRS